MGQPCIYLKIYEIKNNPRRLRAWEM